MNKQQIMNMVKKYNEVINETKNLNYPLAIEPINKNTLNIVTNVEKVLGIPISSRSRQKTKKKSKNSNNSNNSNNNYQINTQQILSGCRTSSLYMFSKLSRKQINRNSIGYKLISDYPDDFGELVKNKHIYDELPNKEKLFIVQIYKPYFYGRKPPNKFNEVIYTPAHTFILYKIDETYMILSSWFTSGNITPIISNTKSYDEIVDILNPINLDDNINRQHYKDILSSLFGKGNVLSGQILNGEYQTLKVIFIGQQAMIENKRNIINLNNFSPSKKSRVNNTRKRIIRS